MIQTWLRVRRTVLVEQLTERFGPLPDSARMRIDSAEVAELETWTRRVLRAVDLDAVLGAP